MKNEYVCLMLASLFAIQSMADSPVLPDEPSPLVLPATPEAVASFGAHILGENVVVVGGHIGREHQHSRENITGKAWNLPIENGATWEALPDSRPLQGLALVAHGEWLIRVGGLDARNEPGAEDDLHSVADVSAYSRATGTWEAWTPLPTATSSLDAVVLDGFIYVLGGWTLTGTSKTGEWRSHGWRANLEQRPLTWEALPDMPEPKRAGAAAHLDGEVYWLGGMGPDNKPSGKVFAYNPTTKTWREGPLLPIAGRMRGFGCTAFPTRHGILLAGWDHAVFCLPAADAAWEKTGIVLKDRRIFSRLLLDAQERVWILGGADSEGHTGRVERYPLPHRSPIGVSNERWPSFRGDGRNYTPCINLPPSWSATSNLLYRVALEGYGQSSPVLWEQTLYVTQAIGTNKLSYTVAAFDTVDGTKRWEVKLPNSRPEDTSPYRSQSAPSPCADPNGVYAFFESGQIIAINHEGAIRWTVDLGARYTSPAGNHGIAASLAQTDDTLFVMMDHDGPGFLAALHKEDGRERWKNEREKRVSWTSPLMTDAGLLVSSNGKVEEFSPADGTTLWTTDSWEKNTLASPLALGKTVIFASSQRGNSGAIIRRISAPNSEPITARWTSNRAVADFASPVLAGEVIVLCGKPGIAFGVHPETGETLWEERLPATMWSTPLVTDHGVYFFTRDGETWLAKVSVSGMDVLQRSTLDLGGERVYAAIAAHDTFYIRTGRELIALKKM